jgi:hypothetical protein
VAIAPVGSLTSGFEAVLVLTAGGGTGAVGDEKTCGAFADATLLTTRCPNKSARITEMMLNTKIQSTTKNPVRTKNRANSLKRAHRLPGW